MSEVYSWLAIKAASADEACDKLGLTRSGDECDYLESVFSGAALPTAWYVVVTGREAFDFFMDFSLEQLSESHDLMVMEVEEHVMQFSLEYWRDGAVLWSVLHDAQQGVYHLEGEGELPGDFDALKAEYVKQQDEAGGENASVDCLCEVPLELALSVTGFRYNLRYEDSQEPVFEELDVSYNFEETAALLRSDNREEAEALPPEQEPRPEPDTEPPEPSRLERFLMKWFGR
jgi:hypothetical protein